MNRKRVVWELWVTLMMRHSQNLMTNYWLLWPKVMPENTITNDLLCVCVMSLSTERLSKQWFVIPIVRVLRHTSAAEILETRRIEQCTQTPPAEAALMIEWVAPVALLHSTIIWGWTPKVGVEVTQLLCTNEWKRSTQIRWRSLLTKTDCWRNELARWPHKSRWIRGGRG